MEVIIKTSILRKNSITPDQAFFLYLLLYKDWKSLRETFNYNQAEKIRNSLVDTIYIITDDINCQVKDTVISTKNVQKLFEIKEEIIPFVEFYNKYPIKVGGRVLRAKDLDTVIGKKHKKKYLSKVKTKEQHNRAVEATESFVDKQKSVGKLQYLPNMETVLNNAMWESWVSLIEVKGKEGQEWNDEIV